MGPNSNPLELTILSLKPTYAPKSLNTMLSDLNEKIHNPLEKLIILNDYIQKHKEELAWVQSLETRELPQCMLLLMDAIDTLKEEMVRIIRNLGARECDEPEFETWKKKRYEELLEETSISKKYLREGANSPPAYNSGNPKTDLDATDYEDRVSLQLKHKTYGREFSEKGKEVMAKEPSQTGFPCDLNKEAGDEAMMYQPQLIPLLQPTWKNNRRNWTPELHTSFVAALNFLGGPEVATPKQIKDHMNVEGLTNDQVKSHLQKYRLNLRGSNSPGGGGASSSRAYHQALLQDPWMTPSSNFLRPISIFCHSKSLQQQQQQQQQQQLQALRNVGVGVGVGSSTGGSNIRDNAETCTKKPKKFGDWLYRSEEGGDA